MRTQLWLSVGFIAAGLMMTQAVHAQARQTTAMPKSIMLKQAPTKPAGKRLDLRPPKLTEVFSKETIDRALSGVRDRETLEEVEVEGRRSKAAPRTPIVPGGIAAPFWALAHPTQAWRILAPLPPDQAQLLNNTPPDATDSYRPPTLPPM